MRNLGDLNDLYNTQDEADFKLCKILMASIPENVIQREP